MNIVLALKSEIRDWPIWWKSLSLKRKVAPLILVLAWWAGLLAVHGLKADHLQIGAVTLLLSYAGSKAQKILLFLLPLILTGAVYDSQRFWGDYVRGAIHVEEPYLFDKTLFGIPTSMGVLTPNEWWQLHTHPLLDLVTGFFYLTFILIFVLFAAWYRRIRMMWAFFWLNCVGYSTYYWYAAAPPWYVALYGLGPANMEARPNPAGCIRFDQLLGTHFFTGMYGRSADVFGAIPSLHVAYPFLAVIYAHQMKRGRVFAWLFYLVMCFSAVYLNHHYILDILWGSSYAIGTFYVVEAVAKIRARRRAVA